MGVEHSMDANRWLVFVWLAVALALGSIVVFSALFLWRAIFRRRTRGWAQDSVLLGLSGLVLVFVLIAYVITSSQRVAKEWQSTLGCCLLVAVALVLVRVSRSISRH